VMTHGCSLLVSASWPKKARSFHHPGECVVYSLSSNLPTIRPQHTQTASTPRASHVGFGAMSPPSLRIMRNIPRNGSSVPRSIENYVRPKGLPARGRKRHGVQSCKRKRCGFSGNGNPARKDESNFRVVRPGFSRPGPRGEDSREDGKNLENSAESWQTKWRKK